LEDVSIIITLGVSILPLGCISKSLPVEDYDLDGT
jgi:hypothetical protein